MLRVGLTGGIGAGKSTIAARLEQRGAVLIDADALAREVVEPGTPGLAAVVEAFGPTVLAPDSSLDRAALGALVFADPDARRRLGAVLHPRIAALTAERIAALPPACIVVHDVPLLVENRMGAGYHLVIVVDAPEYERVRRLVEQRGMTQDDARARVAAQADTAARRAAADVWIDNSGETAAALHVVDDLWDRRLVPFERNVRERRAAARPAAVAVIGPDPSWPEQAARTAERVTRAAGGADAVVRIDHVGPTAVPGLAAEDVVALQLVVPGGDPTVRRVHEGLAEAGFVSGPGPGAAPGYLSADPGRAVELRVWPLDDAGWRDALLLRDWLRAHDAERGAFAAVAQVAQGLDAGSYRERTGAWTGPALARARAWATRAGWHPDAGLAV